MIRFCTKSLWLNSSFAFRESFKFARLNSCQYRFENLAGNPGEVVKLKKHSSCGLRNGRRLCSTTNSGTNGETNNHAKGQHIYTVRIVTGKRRGAGTTAQVFVRLIGSKGKTGKYTIDRNFETASVVEENLTAAEDLGTILKVHIGHDNIGDQGVGWYLEHVDVISPCMQEYYFPVQRWLGQSDFGVSDPLPCFVKVTAADPFDQGHQGSNDVGLHLQLPLKIEVGAAAFPHPDKVKNDGLRGVVQSRLGHAGEDAYSISPIVVHKGVNIEKSHDVKKSRLTTSSSQYVVCAVADGVYSWRHQGIDAGKYSRFFVRSVQNAAQKHVVDGADVEDEGAGTTCTSTLESSRPDPLQLLAAAEQRLHMTNDLKGSCTACVCCIDGEQGVLKVANLGDSGAMVVRRGTVIFKTPEQEHQFGFPFQLPTDSASDAQEYTCNIFDGDVVVLGSDGLFDNVSDEQIEEIIRKEVSFLDHGSESQLKKIKHARTTPSLLANILASKAFFNSIDKSISTPYSMGASEAFNMVYTGGKMDDICCVTAILSADSETDIHRFQR